MSIFHEYTSIFEYADDAMMTQYDIDVMRLNTKFAFESALGVPCESIIQEAEESKSNSSFGDWIKKMTARIQKFLSDICKTIKEAFSRNDHIDIDEYLKSSTGSVELDFDLQTIQDKVDDEVRKGRSLIQSIAKGTNIDDATVEAYVDRAADAVNKYAKPATITAGSIAIFKSSEAKMKKMSKEVGDAAKDAEKVKGDPKKEKAATKIFNTINHLVSEAGRARVQFCKQVQNAAKKSKKKNGGK